MQEPERFKSPAYLGVLDATPATQVCRMNSQSLGQMQADCAAGYPLEACGLLIGRIASESWQIDEARAVPNLNTQRAADRFQLDPDAYRQIDSSLAGTDKEIIGIYHSHPDCPARPSPTDLEGAWEGFAYIIVSIQQGEATETLCWALNGHGDKFQPVTLKEIA